MESRVVICYWIVYCILCNDMTNKLRQIDDIEAPFLDPRRVR